MLLSKCCQVDVYLAEDFHGESWQECSFCFQPCETYVQLETNMDNLNTTLEGGI